VFFTLNYTTLERQVEKGRIEAPYICLRFRHQNDLKGVHRPIWSRKLFRSMPSPERACSRARLREAANSGKFCTFLLLPTYPGICQLSKPDLKASVHGAAGLGLRSSIDQMRNEGCESRSLAKGSAQAIRLAVQQGLHEPDPKGFPKPLGSWWE